MVKNPLAKARDVGDAGSIPGKIPWRRAWQPTPVFLLGESHAQRSESGGLQSMALQRVGHNGSDSMHTHSYL